MRLFRKKAEVSPDIAKMQAFTTILMKLELPKKLMRFGINFLAEHMMKKAIALKKQHGFNNKEMQIIYEVLTDVIQGNEKAWTGKDELSGHMRPAYNKDRRLWTNVRDIVCTGADSDTYYTLRVWHVLDGLFARESEFKMQEKKESFLWNYEEFSRAKAYNELWEKKVEELRKQDLEKIMGENNG